MIFKTIHFVSQYQRKTRFSYKSQFNRSVFVFQNQNDINFIQRHICNIKNKSCFLIPGSGVPEEYISKSKKFKKESLWLKSKSKKDYENLKMKLLLFFVQITQN